MKRPTDEETLKAITTYTGKVKRCRPGKARAPDPKAKKSRRRPSVDVRWHREVKKGPRKPSVGDVRWLRDHAGQLPRIVDDQSERKRRRRLARTPRPAKGPAWFNK